MNTSHLSFSRPRFGKGKRVGSSDGAGHMDVRHVSKCRVPDWQVDGQVDPGSSLSKMS